MTTLRIPLNSWGEKIAKIDMDKLLEDFDENPWVDLPHEDDIIKEWCDDLPEHLHQDFADEFKCAIEHSCAEQYYQRIKSAIEQNTSHVLYELSPSRLPPQNYSLMRDLPGNFPEIEYSIVSGDGGDEIVFSGKSLAPLSLAVMACLQGHHGEYFDGLRDFHDTYCIETVADLANLVGWLGRYWEIWGDRPIEVDTSNLDACFTPRHTAIKIKNALLRLVD